MKKIILAIAVIAFAWFLRVQIAQSVIAPVQASVCCTDYGNCYCAGGSYTPPLIEGGGLLPGPVPTSTVYQVNIKCHDAAGNLTRDYCAGCGTVPDSNCEVASPQCETNLCAGTSSTCTGKCGGTAHGWVDRPDIGAANCPQDDSAYRVYNGECQQYQNICPTVGDAGTCNSTTGAANQYGDGTATCTWISSGTCVTGCSATCGGGMCADICGNHLTCNTQTCNTPPQATVDCPASPVNVGASVPFTAHGTDANSNLYSMAFYFSPTTSQSWSRLETNETLHFCYDTNNNFVNCDPNVPCSGATCNVTATWKPTAADAGKSFWMVPDFFDSAGGKCSSNPWLPLPSGWVECSNPASNSRCQVTVNQAPPPPTLTCGTFDPSTASTPVTASNWTGSIGLQVTRDLAPDQQTDITKWLYNASATSPKTIFPDPANNKYMPPGHTVYARTTYDSTNFSPTASITCPAPSNPSSVTISGPLQQKSGTGCYQANASNNFQVQNPTTTTNPSSCVSTNCQVLPNTTNAQTYSCTTAFNSQSCLNNNPPTWPTSATVNLTGVAPLGYTFVGWTPNGSCSPANNSKTLNAGDTVNNQPITFNFTGDNWIKLKNSSFGAINTNSIAVPGFVTAYDGSGDDDGSKYFIIGTAGNAAGVTVSPNTAYSSPNWHIDSYSQTPHFDPLTFLSYVQSRKQYTPLSSLSANLSSDITSAGIYYYASSSSQAITAGPTVNAVLIVNGDITIGGNISSSGFALVVNGTITILPTVTELKGIYTANNFETGSTENQGLKIIGNLIVKSSLTNQRAWSDTSKPRLFVVFDPVQYMNLLPYLSIAKYEQTIQ